MNKLKFAIALTTFICLSTVHANENIELKKEKIGSVVYRVSKITKELFVELPFKVDLSLVELDGEPRSARFFLQGFAELDGSSSRADLKQLIAKYPGFVVDQEGGSLSIDKCEVVIGKKNIPCAVPPVESAYFSFSSILSTDEATELKSIMKQDRDNLIHVDVKFGSHYLKVNSKKNINLAQLCAGISNSTLGGAINQLSAFTRAQYGSRVPLSAQAQLIDIALGDCMSVDVKSELQNAGQILDLKMVKKNISAAEQVTLYDLESRVRESTRRAITDINFQTGE